MVSSSTLLRWTLIPGLTATFIIRRALMRHFLTADCRSRAKISGAAQLSSVHITPHAPCRHLTITIGSHPKASCVFLLRAVLKRYPNLQGMRRQSSDPASELQEIRFSLSCPEIFQKQRSVYIARCWYTFQNDLLAWSQALVFELLRKGLIELALPISHGRVHMTEITRLRSHGSSG